MIILTPSGHGTGVRPSCANSRTLTKPASGGRQSLQLARARQLAGVPELFVAAAEQYLLAVGAVADTAERRQVAGLLQRAAGQGTRRPGMH